MCYSVHVIPFVIEDSIQKLGRSIAIARKRRRLTQAELATKAGLTRLLLSRIERGAPTSGIQNYFAALWALGLEREFLELASPDRDEEGKRLERMQLPQRVRKSEEAWDDES